MFVVHQPANTIIAEQHDKFHGRENYFLAQPEKQKAGARPAFV
jgi:hypothetical protein